MSGSITIQLPEEVLIEALQQLSPERRRQIFQQLDENLEPDVVPLSPNALDGLVGIISVGGDALVESEQIYDE